MILQIYSEIGQKLVSNIDEIDIVDGKTIVSKDDFGDWFLTQIKLDRPVFTIKDCIKSTEYGDQLTFVMLILKKTNGKVETVYVQNLLTAYVLNDSGKTLQRINQ